MTSPHASHSPDGAVVRLVVAKSQTEQAVCGAAGHVGASLWRLMKDGHTAEAKVRPIENVGVELRYEWNGDLRVSQVFKAWEAPEAAANQKRQELEARGWLSEL